MVWQELDRPVRAAARRYKVRDGVARGWCCEMLQGVLARPRACRRPHLCGIHTFHRHMMFSACRPLRSGRGKGRTGERKKTRSGVSGMAQSAAHAPSMGMMCRLPPVAFQNGQVCWMYSSTGISRCAFLRSRLVMGRK
eukprot:362860-Chlamydomonas_euryale.AAC.8